MADRVVFIASVIKKHILQFHLPYMKWFKDRGYIVDVIGADDYEPGEDKTIPYCDNYYEIPLCRSPFSSLNFKIYKQIKKIAEENNYVLAHCHTPVTSVVARMALKKSRKKGTKVLYTAHGFHFYKGAPKKAVIYKLAEKLMINNTDAIITINEEDYNAAVGFCKNKKCKAYKVPGVGVDLDTVRMGCDRDKTRDSFGIPRDAFVVMSNSEINKNKNVITSIKAVAKTPGVYLFISGSGDTTEICRMLIKELSCEDRIILAGYRKDAKRLLSMADAFILPSFREGLPTAPIEAMAANLPIIVADNRGTREYAVQGENAFICSPDDVEGFARAITTLKENRELRLTMGEKARKSAEKYNLSNALKAHGEIYEEYLKG